MRFISRSLASLTSALALSLVAGTAGAATRQVGSGKTYPAPCAAFAAATSGDVIEIDAGTYSGDVCEITTSTLTIRGVGGRPKIDAAGKNAQGKGTWVVSGNDITIENVEMLGSAVPDHNGAALRLQGTNVTLRGVYLHDNENGILGGAGVVLIESSELAHNGNCIDPAGCAHNAYLSANVTSFTFKSSYSHGATSGHELKSRAQKNFILYSRITDEDGTASYSIDLPNGGTSVILGNLIEQSKTTENPTLVTYGEEGLSNAGHDLYVVHNTFVNTLGSGTFVAVASGAAPALLQNNVFMGGGTPTSQANATLVTNFIGDAKLVSASTFDYRLLPGSPAIDTGTPVTAVVDGQSLAAIFQYRHPLALDPRTIVGSAPDVGAYELGAPASPANDGGAPVGSDGGGLSAGDAGGSVAAAGGAPPSPAATDDASDGCACRTSGVAHASRLEIALLACALALAIGRTRRR